MSATAYEILQAARAQTRQTASDYISALIEEPFELHGDRVMADDPAIVSGVGYIYDLPVTYIGIEKGKTIEERILRNFGSPGPEGYRKALRLMEGAEKFRRPVLCLVDTAGAGAGESAEAHGQGQIISQNIARMSELKTPVITVIIGEGGSGGALGLAVCDRLVMLENAVYSVISPEGCASILWKDSSRVAQAAESLRITAADMVHFGIAEEIIPEDFSDFCGMTERMKKSIYESFTALLALEVGELLEKRYHKFRKIGDFEK